MATVLHPARRFTVDEFWRLVETGVIPPEEPVELLAGVLVAKVTPQSPEHADIVTALAERLRRVYGPQFRVREEKPLDCGPESLPEPDIAVVPADLPGLRSRHPRADEALLVVEVAVSSRAVDARKGRIYAEAGVPVYWIVDVAEGQVIEHRVSAQGDGTYMADAQRTELRVPGLAERISIDEVLG